MRTVCFWLCLWLVGQPAEAQDRPLGCYTAGVLQRVTFRGGKPVAATLVGLDVELRYDGRSRACLITYHNQHAQLDSLSLAYVGQQGTSQRMRQRGTGLYYILVDCQLRADGMLLLSEEQGEGDVTRIITGLTPCLFGR
jgi:hypothetical protein